MFWASWVFGPAGLQETAHERRGTQLAVPGLVQLLAAENGAAFLPLAQDPVKQVPEGDAVHTVAHFNSSYMYTKFMLSRSVCPRGALRSP